MNKMQIKFSHSYAKLLSSTPSDIGAYIQQAFLLQVLTVNLEDLSKPFLDYDTDFGTFDLPKKGKFLLLLYRKIKEPNLFTTLRKWTEEKERYYREATGQRFDIGYKSEKTLHYGTIRARSFLRSP